MTQKDQQQLGKTLWKIADDLRGAMNADSFRDYMLSFLFLRYLSHNYEESAKKELGPDYPELAEEDKPAPLAGGRTPLAIWYAENEEDVPMFEKQMRRKVHYVIKPQQHFRTGAHAGYCLQMRLPFASGNEFPQSLAEVAAKSRKGVSVLSETSRNLSETPREIPPTVGWRAFGCPGGRLSLH